MNVVGGVVILFLVLIVPGASLALLSRQGRLPLLAAIILGYAWTLTLLHILRLSQWGVVTATTVYVTLTLILFLAALVTLVRRNGVGVLALGWFTRYWAFFLVCAALVAGYHLIVGPYEELPSDVYRHLEYLWAEFGAKQDGGFGRPVEGLGQFGKEGQQWYLMHAWIAHLLGVLPHQLAPAMALFHVTVLAVVAVAFALHQFSRLRMTRRAKLAAAALAGALFCLHFGMDVFAFIRYYAIAPAVGAYAIYLAAVVFLAEFLQYRRGYGALVLWGLGGAIAGLVHVQEAVFVGVVSLLVAGLLVVDSARRVRGAGGGVRVFWTEHRRAAVFFTVVATLAAVAWIWSYFNLRRIAPRDPLQLSLEAVFPFLRNLYILNPTFQFFMVVTLWGLVVLALFLIWRKELKTAIVVRAGVLSTLLVPLNPLFVDFFLRVAHPIVLWRMTFIIPLFAVGAWLLIRSLIRIRQAPRIAARLGHGLVAGVLVLLLVPFETTYLVNAHSRLGMLGPVPRENTWHHWGDLVDALNSLDSDYRILTDPVTGYLLSATTRHERDGNKFARPRQYILDREDVELHWFRSHAGRLLVINRRNGGYSVTGERGRHWRANQLDVEGYYSDHVRSLVAAHPEVFNHLWGADRVDVYRIEAVVRDSVRVDTQNADVVLQTNGRG